MGDYSTTEIGMLAGAVIGGMLAVLGFLTTGNMYFLLSAAAGIGVGIAAGKIIDKKKTTHRQL